MIFNGLFYYNDCWGLYAKSLMTVQHNFLNLSAFIKNPTKQLAKFFFNHKNHKFSTISFPHFLLC